MWVATKLIPAMTRELIRYQKSGAFHFVTFSCYRRLPLLGSASAYPVSVTVRPEKKARWRSNRRGLPENASNSSTHP